MKLSLLKQKDFSLLVTSKLISLIGNVMQEFALSLYVLKITGSATKFASVLAISILPQLFLGSVCGVLTDWFDNKKIIIYLDLLNGLIIGLFYYIYMTNNKFSITQIYILVILLSFILSLYSPTINAIIPSIVSQKELIYANSINSLFLNLGNFVAPLIASFLFGLYGLNIVLLINAVSFIICGTMEVFINIPKISNKSKNINSKAFFDNFSEGIKFLKNSKLILAIIKLAMVVNFAYTPIMTVGVTYISKEILKVSDYKYALLQSTQIVSMFIAPIIAMVVVKKIDIKRVLLWDISINSILFIIMSIIPSPLFLKVCLNNLIPYILLIINMFFISSITTVENIVLTTVFQREVPIEFIGRVGSVLNTGTMIAIPIGQIFFGLLFDVIQGGICILISGLILSFGIIILKNSLLTSN
ncbi:MFS transporter [uncultured Clostridium sp.]|uniref:MFS transporter n=1 Tax=uncultured Clostridium sp. TaxID=59620 RepID=UPI0028E8026D|nr:MFS transporter [uncultured Clostridium sp.]